jgi:hypothetical protein
LNCWLTFVFPITGMKLISNARYLFVQSLRERAIVAAYIDHVEDSDAFFGWASLSNPLFQHGLRKLIQPIAHSVKGVVVRKVTVAMADIHMQWINSSIVT